MRKFLGVLGLVCFAALVYWLTMFSSDKKNVKPVVEQPKTFKAVLFVAHKADHVRQVNIGKELAKRIEDRSQGRLKIELKFPDDKKDGNYYREALTMVMSNAAQLTTTSTPHLAALDPQFQVFEMPFLFRSNEHAFHVMDGEIGTKLKDHLLQATQNNLRILSYSYGGGFRQFISNKQITKVSQLAGLRMHYFGPTADPKEDIKTNPALARLLEILAYKMTPVMNESHPEYTSGLDFFKNNLVDITDDHYGNVSRLYKNFGPIEGKMKYIWEVDHSLFVTAYVVNERFFQTLPKDLQTIVQEEAQRMAIEDREGVVKVNQNSKEELIKSGTVVTPISAKEKKIMIKASHAVYDKLEPLLGSDLIKAIEDLDKTSSATPAAAAEH